MILIKSSFMLIDVDGCLWISASFIDCHEPRSVFIYLGPEENGPLNFLRDFLKQMRLADGGGGGGGLLAKCMGPSA